jgi:hypothetical protein
MRVRELQPPRKFYSPIARVRHWSQNQEAVRMIIRYDGKIIVACHGIHYKAPLDMMAQHQDSEFPIVYGVLSGPGEGDAKFNP